MKLILIVLIAISSSHVFAQELMLCGDDGPKVRLFESKVTPGVPSSDSYLQIAGVTGQNIFASMTKAPSFLCNSGPGDAYRTTCIERGTPSLNCQQITYKDYGCADYVCSVTVSDLERGKL